MKPRESLKTRFELVLAAVTGILLFVTAATLIIVRYRDQKKLLEDNAMTFAQTTVDQICQQYRIYYHSGSYKFREIVRRNMAWNPDIRRILILSVAGEVLYDSAESPDYNLQVEHPVRRLADTRLTEATAELNAQPFHARDPKLGSLLLILSPYMEEWGRHPYSVLYVFTYDSLNHTLQSMALPIAILLMLSLGVMAGVARWLAGRVARPIEELTRGVRAFEEGRSVAPLDITSGDEIGVLAQTFNSMARRLEEHVQQLERANEELKAVDRMKTDLLANVSHELRTPLSAIRGYVEFMSDGNLGPVSEPQSKGLSICMRNIDRLNKNINMLLDFSRMELGRIVVHPAPFRLDLLVRQIAASLDADARKKGLRLLVDAAESLPAVVADRERLTQVIENLTVNSIKFTPAGGEITLSLSLLAEGNRVEVRIADNGIGIAPADRDRVFEKFYQVEAGAARRFGGVGLGLAIVKSVLDAHHVPISVEERPGGGTLFRFALPAYAGRPSLVEIPVIDEPLATPATRILAIDDDADFLSYLGDSLRGEGREIISATTAQDGLRLAREHSPALILLDVHLPDGDGFDLLQSLKSDPLTSNIPTIIVTVVNERMEGFRLGADDYLVKPVESAMLLDAVGRALDGPRADEGPPQVLVIDDEPDVTAYLSTVLSSRGYRVLRAASGPEGLEMAFRHRPTLIILDVMMPEMTGWEVLRRLRDSPLRQVPVIVLSARESPSDSAEGYRLGARSYLAKTSGAQKLLEEIRTVLGSPPDEAAS